MAIEIKMIKVDDPADPRRCQSPGDMNEGQCVYRSVDGTNPPQCPKHGGIKFEQKQEQLKIRQYRLQIWQERMTEFADDANIKSLREEIGIIRLLIENVLNQCSDSAQLSLYSGKIAELVMKAEKLVVSCDKLETKFGMLLDKAAILTLGSEIVKIIGKHVKETAAIDAISGDIIDVLSSLGSDPNA